MRCGQRFRAVDLDGGQVVALNAWTLLDSKEPFWSGRTRILESGHLSTGNRPLRLPCWQRNEVARPEQRMADS